jgi:hypothetical protein
MRSGDDLASSGKWLDPRRPYTTSGIAIRRVHRDGKEETDVNTWNGTAFADSEEKAVELTLDAMRLEWPEREGWERHTAFARRIGDDSVRLWIEVIEA